MQVYEDGKEEVWGQGVLFLPIVRGSKGSERPASLRRVSGFIVTGLSQQLTVHPQTSTVHPQTPSKRASSPGSQLTV